MSNYPNSAGYKTTSPGTSREAAAGIDSRAKQLRARVLRQIQARPAGITADECAAMMGESILAVRPRFSELRNQGMIEPAAERRPSSTGKASAVWKYRQLGQASLL